MISRKTGSGSSGRRSRARTILRAVAILFNVAFAALALFAFWDLQTSSDPGAAIGFVMIPLYGVVGNLFIGLLLFLFRPKAR